LVRTPVKACLVVLEAATVFKTGAFACSAVWATYWGIR